MKIDTYMLLKYICKHNNLWNNIILASMIINSSWEAKQEQEN